MKKDATNEQRAENPDFETALSTLEDLVSRMETGELSLEESLAAFEQGIQLTRTCQQALQKAEQKISVLVNENGSENLQALVIDEQDATEQ